MKENSSKTAKFYLKYKLISTMNQLLKWIDNREGTNALRRMRCNAFESCRMKGIKIPNKKDTAKHMIEWKEYLMNNCPMCNQRIDGGENNKHYLLYCSRWRVERKEYLLPAISQTFSKDNGAYTMFNPEDHEEDDILALLLGGSVNNYHPIKKNKHTGRKDWIWHTAEFLKQTQRERKEIMSEINFQITNELFVE